MALTVQVTDGASDNLTRIAKQLGPTVSGPIAGRAVANAIRSHLFRRDGTHPNSLGGRRTHFWAQAARSTNFQPKPDGAEVTISFLGFRLQFEGGTIKPVNKKFLTIPVAAEAHGRRASEFDDLEFAVVPGYGPALVRAQSQQIKVGKKGVTPGSVQGGEVIFRLAKQATIPAHPDALPAVEIMKREAVAALTGYYNRNVASGGGTT